MSNEALKSIKQLTLNINFINECSLQTEALVLALAEGKSFLSREPFSENEVRLIGAQLQKTMDSALRLLKAYEDVEIQRALCADKEGKKLFSELQEVKKNFESLRSKIIGSPVERLLLEATLSSPEGLIEVVGSPLLSPAQVGYPKRQGRKIKSFTAPTKAVSSAVLSLRIISPSPIAVDDFQSPSLAKGKTRKSPLSREVKLEEPSDDRASMSDSDTDASLSPMGTPSSVESQTPVSSRRSSVMSVASDRPSLSRRKSISPLSLGEPSLVDAELEPAPVFPLTPKGEVPVL
jgi:hypothetical protein